MVAHLLVERLHGTYGGWRKIYCSDQKVLRLPIILGLGDFVEDGQSYGGVVICWSDRWRVLFALS
jgi:hypothetical protein